MLSAAPSESVSIGDVSVKRFDGHLTHSALVPRGYLPDVLPQVGDAAPQPLWSSLAFEFGQITRLCCGSPQETLEHLRWLMQKDSMGQDVFLLGVPGPHRRRLIMMYCELVGREVEFVTVSRDTTDADLKQRREIVGGSAVFSDQAPVRAAIHGRLLVIDGIEKGMSSLPAASLSFAFV